MANREEYVSGEQFHQGNDPVYRGEVGWAVNKSHALMAKVVYTAVHLNERETGPRRGAGKDYATWVFSEEHPKAEGLFASAFELMIDARLEPGAAIGLHEHGRTEEIYYLLEGELTMTTRDERGREHTHALHSGDAHLVRLGQSHWGQAGSAGARFIAIGLRAR